TAGRRSSRSASWRSRVKTVAPRRRAAKPAATACARNEARGRTKLPRRCRTRSRRTSRPGCGSTPKSASTSAVGRGSLRRTTRRTRLPARARAAAVFTICTPFARSRGKRMSARIMISRGSLTAAGSRLLQHALDVADHHVLRPRRRLHAPAQRAGERAAEEAGDVAVLAQGAEPRAADPRREPPHRDPLPEVVLLLLPLLGEGDEGVGLFLLLERPRGMAGQEAERAERGPPAEQDVKGNGHEQAREVGARQGEKGSRREVEHSAPAQDAVALGEVGLRGGDVLDHRMAEDEVEALAREGQAGAVALDEDGVGEALLRGQPRARLAEAGLQVEAHREGRFLRQRERGPPAPAAGVEYAAAEPSPSPLEGLDHLRAAQVLEDRVVVLAAEAGGGGGGDGRLVDVPHLPSASR